MTLQLHESCVPSPNGLRGLTLLMFMFCCRASVWIKVLGGPACSRVRRVSVKGVMMINNNFPLIGCYDSNDLPLKEVLLK